MAGVSLETDRLLLRSFRPEDPAPYAGEVNLLGATLAYEIRS